MVKFNAQSEVNNSKPDEELFVDSKRQALIVLFLFICFTYFCCPYYVNCLFVSAGSHYPYRVGGENEVCLGAAYAEIERVNHEKAARVIALKREHEVEVG